MPVTRLRSHPNAVRARRRRRFAAWLGLIAVAALPALTGAALWWWNESGQGPRRLKPLPRPGQPADALAGAETLQPPKASSAPGRQPPDPAVQHGG
jgi:hypothetical protein